MKLDWSLTKRNCVETTNLVEKNVSPRKILLVTKNSCTQNSFIQEKLVQNFGKMISIKKIKARKIFGSNYLVKIGSVTAEIILIWTKMSPGQMLL